MLTGAASVVSNLGNKDNIPEESAYTTMRVFLPYLHGFFPFLMYERHEVPDVVTGEIELDASRLI